MQLPRTPDQRDKKRTRTDWYVDRVTREQNTDLGEKDGRVTRKCKMAKLSVSAKRKADTAREPATWLSQ